MLITITVFITLWWLYLFSPLINWFQHLYQHSAWDIVTIGYTGGQMDRQTSAHMHTWMDGWTNKYRRQMDKGMESNTDRQMYGQRDECRLSHNILAPVPTFQKLCNKSLYLSRSFFHIKIKMIEQTIWH